MNTKPNLVKMQEYNSALKELNILNPIAENVNFKQIFSNNSMATIQLPNDAQIYLKLRGKLAHYSPKVLKRVVKKSARVAKNILPKKTTAFLEESKQLSEVEIDEALKLRAKEPIVTIVIPVYNNLDYTKKCILSLVDHNSRYKFEILIADDQSTDETEQYFGQIKSIRYVRNKTNLGFLLSCNNAVKQVTTKYTILLNNDTRVLEGWLNGLIQPLENDKNIGLVGSKLIYPDGTLQEAGGIIFSDGNAYNYGKNAAPSDYEYNYVREVDYVSGASIAFATKVFKSFGGFDKEFTPAYYEDTDLAMQMRKNNLKVIYNPFSSLIHYEGKSMGTDTESGLKTYQKINKEKFYKKWKSILQAKHYKGPEDILLASERGVTKHILVCDIHVPFPDRDAGSVRMHAILTCLRELGYHVTLWSDTHCLIDKYTQDLQANGIEVVYGTIPFEDFIAQRSSYFDTAILSRPIVAPRYLPLIRYYSPQTKIIFDTVDLHYIRLGRQAKLENDSQAAIQADKWKIIETGLMLQSDISLVVSSFEATELKRELPNAHVEIVSLIHTLKNCKKSFDKRKDLLFIGSYNHAPNKDGLRWFVDEVWPIFIKKQPKARLRIIGSDMPSDLLGKEVKNIEVLGFVEDPTLYFESSRVFIAPLRFGAGVKGKILQAIEYAMPVVTTSVGAEGMHLKDKVSALVADSPQDFADNMNELYTNKKLWNDVSKNSQKVLEDHFSREVAKKELKSFI